MFLFAAQPGGAGSLYVRLQHGASAAVQTATSFAKDAVHLIWAGRNADGTAAIGVNQDAASASVPASTLPDHTGESRLCIGGRSDLVMLGDEVAFIWAGKIFGTTAADARRAEFLAAVRSKYGIA